MQTPEDVQAMLKLALLGWGSKRISRELGCSRNTVRSYLRQGGWQPYQSPQRPGRLAAYRDWLADRFRQHRGACDVVRQELQREHGVKVSLRTVERAVAHLRREVFAQTAATVRFETPPGHQLQMDFGTVRVPVGDEQTKVHLFVATLGYSRRTYVGMFLHERQSAWLQGLEGAFRHFGGTPREVLIDNARALVNEHDAQTREVTFNDRFHAFCRYWGVTPRACAPYRARTKGKDERGVGYVKRNAIAGHRFATLEELQAHLLRWMREVADVRVHGTTAEPPIDRFERDERSALAPLGAKAPSCRCANSAAGSTPMPASNSTPTATACLGSSSARPSPSLWPNVRCGCCTPARKSPATPRALAGAAASSSAVIWRASSVPTWSV
jgi:transposase